MMRKIEGTVKFGFIIWCFLAFNQISFGQVKVRVLVDQEKEPIENASIIVTVKDFGSKYKSTDKKGYCILDTSNLETPTIYVQHVDYKYLMLSLKQLKEANYHIYLQPVYSEINPFDFYGPKRNEKKDEVVMISKNIDQKAFKMQVPQTSADILESGGNVFIQKSQLGGGSPMIRGFAANRVLLIVDGVRINNAIFRDGNVHNVISFDPNMLEGVDIYEGPGSVIFGSDAMGGVMFFKTKKLETSNDSIMKFGGNTSVNFHSANRGNSWHFDFGGKSQKFAFVSGLTLSNYGSLRMGSNGSKEFRRDHYIEHRNGRDTVIDNENDLIQEFSGYTQFNFTQKFLYAKDSFFSLKAGFNFATTSPIPRYDRLTQFDGSNYRYTEWNYGPQKWLMTYLSGDWKKATPIYDRFRLGAAFQKVEESRISRLFQDSINNRRTENLDFFSVNLDFDKQIKNTMLYYGVEFLHNSLNSNGETFNIYNFETNQNLNSRYPDGSTWDASAIYLILKHQINDKWFSNGGIRYNVINYFAPFQDNVLATFEEVDRRFTGLNGSLGLNYHPDKRTMLKFNLASGFRAPNIDDLGKIFDSEPGKIIVPNPNLKPENIYSIDLNFTRKPDARSQYGFSLFYSIWDGAIQRSNFNVNGVDSISYEGKMLQVQALVNGEYASIYGANIFGTYRINNAFKVVANYNFQNGQTNDNQPIRHVAPNFGDVHFIYIADQIKVDFYTKFNGAIYNGGLAPSEQAKAYLYASDDDGLPFSPAWYTLNLKMIYTLSTKLNMSFGIENILDQHYRPYSSGISAPGINAIFSLRSRF